MHISVSELLALQAMQGSQLVGGDRGVERVISAVNYMEVPDISRYIKRDELLLTTTYPIKDDAAAQKDLIRVLHNAGVAALAIKPAFHDNDVPEAMINEANRLDFPLIRLPKDASFNEIITPVLDEILNRQALVLKRKEETHRALTDIVLGGGGLRELAEMLANLLGHPIAVHSPHWKLLALCEPDDRTGAPSSKLASEARECAAEITEDTLGDTTVEPGHLVPVKRSGATSWFRVHPVTVAGEVFAYLSIWLGDDPSRPYDVPAIEQASTVVALEITKLRAVATVEQRFRSYFIEDIIQGRIESRNDAISRGASYGWDLTADLWPVLIEIDDFARFYRVADAGAAQALRRLWNAVTMSTAVYAPNCIVVDRGTRIFALLEDEGRALGHMEHMINGELRVLYGLSASFGVGRKVTDVLELWTALDQATAALELGQAINGPGSVTRFDDLGFYRVLFASKGRKEMQEFSDQLLGPLERSDERTNGDLVRTLDCIIACNGNLRQAARELFMHYNTVRYRVGRMHVLTGVDATSAQGLFNFQAALMIRSLGRTR